MALKQALQIVQKQPPVSADGYEPVALVGDYTVEAGLALNDVVEMVVLPAGYVPVDAVAHIEDTDSGSPAMTLDLGLLSGTAAPAAARPSPPRPWRRQAASPDRPRRTSA